MNERKGIKGRNDFLRNKYFTEKLKNKGFIKIKLSTEGSVNTTDLCFVKKIYGYTIYIFVRFHAERHGYDLIIDFGDPKTKIVHVYNIGRHAFFDDFLKCELVGNAICEKFVINNHPTWQSGFEQLMADCHDVMQNCKVL